MSYSIARPSRSRFAGFGLNPSDFNGQQIYDWFYLDGTVGNDKTASDAQRGAAHAAGKRAAWWVAAALWQLGYGKSFGLTDIELETGGPDAGAVAWGDDKAKAWKAWYAKSMGGTGGYFPSSKGSAALLKMQRDLANPTKDVLGPDPIKVVDIKTGGPDVIDITPATTCPAGYHGKPPNCQPGTSKAWMLWAVGGVGTLGLLAIALTAKKRRSTGF